MPGKQGPNRDGDNKLSDRLKEVADRMDRIEQADKSSSMFRFRIRAPYSTSEPIHSQAWCEHSLN